MPFVVTPERVWLRVKPVQSRLIRVFGFARKTIRDDMVAAARFHRILRRGREYGTYLAPQAAVLASGPQEERGLHFICLAANIARQFEFVQSQWLNSGNTFGLGEDQDVLLGPQDCRGTAKMTIPGKTPFLLGPLERFVTVRGGEYFFVPGINGLQFLAAAAGRGAA